MVSSLNLLVPITDGEVAVVSTPGGLRITYRLTLYELALVCAAISITLGIATAMSGSSGAPWVGAILGICVFAANILTLKARFRRFLRGAITSE